MTFFPIFLPSPLYQGNTLSLANAFTNLVYFLTACKGLWRLCVVAGTWDSKNPELYYELLIFFRQTRVIHLLLLKFLLCLHLTLSRNNFNFFSALQRSQWRFDVHFTSVHPPVHVDSISHFRFRNVLPEVQLSLTSFPPPLIWHSNFFRQFC